MEPWCISPPEFCPDERVVSLVSHPPEIEPGTKATIVAPHTGSLYAVQLPDGELHRWFARFELEPLDCSLKGCELLCPGSMARIISTEGHPSHVMIGTIVKIVKVIERVVYYDLIINYHGYHRWLAEFEIVPLSIVDGRCEKGL